MEKTFITTATFSENHYNHFGIHPITASMYGHKKEDIIELEMKISENQDRDNISNEKDVFDYWGWWSNEHQKFDLIYPHLILLRMCFTYGMHSAEEENEGKAYRLEIVKTLEKK